MATDRRILANGTTENTEEVLHTAEGRRVFLGVKGPLRGADGQVFGVYGISRDITERKRAEQLLHDTTVPQSLHMVEAESPLRAA